MADTVLKVSCGGHIHRIILQAEPDFSAVDAAVHRLWPDARPRAAMFINTSGGLCALTAGTFHKFLATAYVGPAQRPVLRLEIQPTNTVSQAAAATVRGDPRPRAAKAAAAKGTWEEDTRGIDDLVRSLGGEEKTVPPTAVKSSKRRLQAHRAGAVKVRMPELADKQEVRMPELADKQEVQGSLGWDAEEKQSEQNICEIQHDAEGNQEIAAHEEPSVDEIAEAGKDGKRKEEGSTEEEERELVGAEPQDSEAWDEEWEQQEQHLDPETFSDLGDPPMTLWPPTPESTPPSSPRACRGQLQPMFWVPVPVWIPMPQ